MTLQQRLLSILALVCAVSVDGFCPLQKCTIRTQQHQVQAVSTSRLPTLLRLQQEQQDDNSDENKSPSNEGNAPTNNNNNNDLTGQTVFQRIFYRLAPASTVEVLDSMVIEERTRYVLDPSRSDGYVTPTGPRTILLRNGRVSEDGEIGDEFATMQTSESNIATHKGAGIYDAALVTALYLASNPSLCKNGVLEVGSELGLASLLGCIGAAHVERRDNDNNNSSSSSNKSTSGTKLDDDILTIAQDGSDKVPTDLKMLTITNPDEVEALELIINNVRASGFSGNKVSVERLDWTTRPIRSVTQRQVFKEHYTIVASDLAFSYPQAKELARTVANRLEPTSRYNQVSDRKLLPRFVHVGPESRDDLVYLHRLLDKGYRMTVDTGYVKVEKIVFQLQMLPTKQINNSFESECQQLDALDLQVKEYQELLYQSLSAIHDPSYMGEGSGEMFFPMETGEYDGTSASSSFAVERDNSSSGGGGGFGIGPW